MLYRRQTPAGRILMLDDKLPAKRWFIANDHTSIAKNSIDSSGTMQTPERFIFSQKALLIASKAMGFQPNW